MPTRFSPTGADQPASLNAPLSAAPPVKRVGDADQRFCSVYLAVVPQLAMVPRLCGNADSFFGVRDPQRRCKQKVARSEALRFCCL
jgi:hypothetical protein